MSGPLRQYFSNSSLRMVFWLTIAFGAVAAPIATYQSLLGIRDLGMGDGSYALVLFGGLSVGTVASVWLGIVTDQKPVRKLVALSCIASVFIGTSIIWVFPSKLTFAIGHGLLIPMSLPLFGQIFALARLAASDLSHKDRDAVVANTRAFFAIPFIFVLPGWGFIIGQGADLLTIYISASALLAAMFVLVFKGWPSDLSTPWIEEKSGLSAWKSLVEIADPAVLGRVALIAGTQLGAAVSGIVLGLIFEQAHGRGADDVGQFFGAFVAIEFCVMMAVGYAVRYMRRLYIITAGVMLYALYLILLPLLASSGWVWTLIVPAGAGGAMIYALSIGYLQDLLGKRAGAGSSLIAVQRAFSEAGAATLFALGTWISGYALVAFMAAGVSLVAIASIILLDRNRPR